MKFLQELVRLTDPNTEPTNDEHVISQDEPVDVEQATDSADTPNPYDEDDLDFDDQANQQPEDPNKQGLIRTVAGAHLVYKRQTEDGTYEEMWTYNTSAMGDEIKTRKAILSGTDISYGVSSSPDGSQQYEMWTAGNAEVLVIRGLPQ